MAKKSKPANPWPEILSALRTRTGWTQQQAADEIGATMRSWRRWEKDEQEPIGPVLYALRCLVKTHAPELLEKLPD